MREVLPQLLAWWEAGESVGMGTVIATFRSAPRPPGASMLVGPDASAVGSVSGGCVEGAVYDVAQEVAGSGTPQLQRYGVSDDDAFAVGLTCGGILDVFVESVSRESFPELGEIAASVGAHEPVAVVTVVKGPDDRLGRRLVLWPDRASGTLGLQRLDDAVAADARGMLVAGRTGLMHVGH
ncbi:MAG TPA: XdhC family protein, partial [Nocardioides sp.]|nr:XdhC family protein [Nocardioides sp.]